MSELEASLGPCPWCGGRLWIIDSYGRFSVDCNVSEEPGNCVYVAIRTTEEHPAKRVQWFGYTARSWQIDLTDPTGRAHAAWWLGSLLPSIPGFVSYHDLETLVGPGSYEAVVGFEDPSGWDEEEADDRINAFVKVALWASNAVYDAR